MKWTRRDRKSGARAAALLVALALGGGTARAEVELLDVFASEPALMNPWAPTIGPDGRLYVASEKTSSVLRFDLTTGAFVDVFASGDELRTPVDMTFGPDGALYVAAYHSGAIQRCHPRTGELLGPFASGPELDGVWSLAFGPDGHLYVLTRSVATRSLLRYDGTTGELMDVLASGLPQAYSLAFHPDGDLLVGVQPPGPSPYPGEVRRYDAATGALLGIFASGGGLGGPLDLVFGPDGDLYIANAWDAVLRYDGTSGVFLEVFLGGCYPTGLCFDGNGHLLVADGQTDDVLRCDASTGALVDVLVEKEGLVDPQGITFGPDGDLFTASFYSRVSRFDGATGAYEGTFAQAHATALSFGPNGDLYTTLEPDFEVHRYDGQTGADLGVFASSPSYYGITSHAWGPDGNLYATSGSYGVERFDGTSGAFIDTFVPYADLLEGPWGIAFGPGGDLYVTVGDVVRRFDGATGAPLGDFVSGQELRHTMGLGFGPDCRLYVCSRLTGEVWRYDWPVPGAPVLAAAGSGLERPMDVAFGPDGHLYVVDQSLDDVLRFRGPATPRDAIAKVEERLARMAQAGVIPAHVGDALTAELQQAQANLDRPGVAVRHLETVVLTVQLQVVRGALSPAEGAALVDGANEAIDTILRDRVCGRVGAGSTAE